MRRSILLIFMLAGSARAEDLAAPPAIDATPTVEFTAATGFASTLPELAGARESSAIVARTREQLPALWAPLVVRLMPQLAFGTPSGAGVRLGIEQAVPLTSRRDAARASLDAETQRLAAEAAALEIEARLDIARAWIDSWSAGATLVEARRTRDLATQIVAVTQRGLTAGAVTTPELADARALLASAETAVLDAEGRARDASFRLGAAIAAPGPRRATGELPSVVLPPLAEQRARLAAIADIPMVRARRIAAIASRARADEATAQRTTEILLGGELTLDPGGDRRVAATVGIAWPLHDRGERERGEWLAEARQLEGEAERATRIARFDLAQALHDVEHSGELLDEIDRALVPAVDDAAARRRRAYELGESTLVEVLAAERTAIAGHQTAIAARADHAWALVRARALLDAGGQR
ncbi:MAG TPA: TolC family protein [Kofleriaceae bacterium]|nr:TolC family protein [Kofleriaceae bacterium]